MYSYRHWHAFLHFQVLGPENKNLPMQDPYRACIVRRRPAGVFITIATGPRAEHKLSVRWSRTQHWRTLNDETSSLVCPTNPESRFECEFHVAAPLLDAGGYRS